MVSMSTDAAPSMAASGTSRRRVSTMAEASMESARRLRAHALLIDLALELNDPVDERLGPRRAAWHEHVNRHDLIHALDDRVVVEHAAAARARAHRDHP